MIDEEDGEKQRKMGAGKLGEGMMRRMRSVPEGGERRRTGVGARIAGDVAVIRKRKRIVGRGTLGLITILIVGEIGRGVVGKIGRMGMGKRP